MDKERVIKEMKWVFRDRPQGIEHTLNVLEYAEEIMKHEDLSETQKELVSIGAILHDIGIPEALRKYGSSKSRFQEKEGAVIARRILEKLGYDPLKTDRILYIVGNHHRASKIDGPDFQILWEADLLENVKKMDISRDPDKLKKWIAENFRTKEGLKKIEEYLDSTAKNKSWKDDPDV